MTAEERKRGLRAAVDAKYQGLNEDAPRAPLYAVIGHLWEIIDSLVEECATPTLNDLFYIIYTTPINPTGETLHDATALRIAQGVYSRAILARPERVPKVRRADSPKCYRSPKCTDQDAHLCLFHRGGCNSDDLSRVCLCACHATAGKEGK